MTVLQATIIRYTLIALAILAVIGGGCFLVKKLIPSNTPLAPTINEKRADSLAITKPIDQALLDSLTARIAARVVPSAVAVAAIKVSNANAERARKSADSLALVASKSADSARAWHLAYDKRTEEAVGLRTTVSQQTTIIFNLKADTTDLRLSLATVSKRLKTTEDVNKGLRDDLEQARQCKVLGLIDCPNRWQAAVLGSAAGAVAVAYFKR